MMFWSKYSMDNGHMMRTPSNVLPLFDTRNTRFADFLGTLRNWGLGFAQTKYMEQNSYLCKEELYFMFFKSIQR